MADDRPRRIGIYGAGAMGSAYGGLLADAGAEVWLVGRSSENATTVEADGLLLTHAGEERRTQPRATIDPSVPGPVDVLMIWTKSQDTEAALAAAAPMVGPLTLVATLQNGLGNMEKIATSYGREATVYGVSTVGGVRTGPGSIELTEATWKGDGHTWMGVLEGDPHGRLDPFAELLIAAGIRTEVRADVDIVIWSKLAMAVPMNSIAAITRLDMGAVSSDPGLAQLLASMTREVVAVARARDVPLTVAAALTHAADTYAAAPGHLPSMLQDVLSGRATEVDALVGELVREGARLGVETPVTATVWRLAATLDRPRPPLPRAGSA